MGGGEIPAGHLPESLPCDLAVADSLCGHQLCTCIGTVGENESSVLLGAAGGDGADHPAADLALSESYGKVRGGRELRNVFPVINEKPNPPTMLGRME